MKHILVITILIVIFGSCTKEEVCKSKTSSFYDHKVYIDTSLLSSHFQDTVLRFQCGFNSKTYYGDCLKCCPSPDCIGTKYFRTINLTDEAVELKLELSGIGEKTFTIQKKDTLNISPLPDYCLNKSWGHVVSLVYK